MEANELYDIADNAGIAVDGFALSSVESLSIMNSKRECFVAIDPFRSKSSADEKVKLGHELGHCMTGAFYNQYIKFDLISRQELRANRWAVRNLVPIDALINAIRNGIYEVWGLAEYFNVTEDFMHLAIEIYNNENLLPRFSSEGA